MKINETVLADPESFADRDATARMHAVAWNEGYSWARCGLSRSCPAFRDASLAEQWLDGYDHGAELHKSRRVNQSIPADATTC